MEKAGRKARSGFAKPSHLRGKAMSIRRRGIASAVLSVGVLLFATGASADQRSDAMIEEVLHLLDAASQTLSHPGDVSSDDKERALSQIRAAMAMLMRLR
jgi:hypothetical protein